jgi:hypothetical protein
VSRLPGFHAVEDAEKLSPAQESFRRLQQPAKTGSLTVAAP